MGSDARIDQLEGCSPESCLSWLRSHKITQDLFPKYIKGISELLMLLFMVPHVEHIF